jgi:hypothetical protein
MAEGAAAGRQDAYWAATKAWQLDQAAGVDMTAWWVRWIIFSDDQANTPAGSRSGYMQAAQAQLNAMPGGYLADYYGPQTGCQALAADPAITWAPPLWQTCAWSGGVYGGTAAMYQAICAPVSPAVAGCDTNFVMKPIAGGDGPDMTPDQDVKFAQMYDWLRVLNIGLVPPGQVPYEKQGELATRLRSIDTNTVKLPPAVAGLVKQSTDILAAVNAGTVTLTDEQIEQLAVHEHKRWMADRIRHGWTYAQQRDNATKKHPCLVPWEQLSDTEKDKDRDAVRNHLASLPRASAMDSGIGLGAALYSARLFRALAKLEARLVGELDSHFKLKDRLAEVGTRYSLLGHPPAPTTIDILFIVQGYGLERLGSIRCGRLHEKMTWEITSAIEWRPR